METYRSLGPERMETIGFFQFMTLTAFRIFSKTTLRREEIDVLILETGIGGRLDYTNSLDKPLCCAITRLDYDHMDLLGHTIELIAGEKAGIIKYGVPLFTPTTQVKEGLNVIQRQCEKIGSPLYLVQPLTSSHAIGIGGGAHQLENAGLAKAMAKFVYSKLKASELLDDVVDSGLAKCVFPGRAQVEQNSTGTTFYLDGAHTPASVEYAVKWYQSIVPKHESQCLIFHCSPDRDGKKMLSIIHEFSPNIKIACFLAPTTGVNPGPLSYHNELAKLWTEICEDGQGFTLTDTKAVKSFLEELKVKHVFVIGSFYLVGDALKYWVDNWSVDKAFSF